MLNPAAEADRVGAVAGGGDLLGPPVIAGASSVDDLLEDTG
jgi:hypothetical protein